MHSTCYKFISLPSSFESSRIELMNKTDHMRHMNGIPWDFSVMSKVLTKQIWHVWRKLISTTSNTFEVNQTFKMTKRHRSLSVWVKWTVTILIVFGLFVWNLPALESEPYRAAQNSSQLCAEEGLLKLLGVSTNFSDNLEQFTISMTQFTHLWSKYVKFVTIFRIWAERKYSLKNRSSTLWGSVQPRFCVE